MKYPPPGRLIDIGGKRLHAQISGEGSAGGPTVVLEAGLAATSLSWALVQPEIAKFARVISYDRAGLGWSDDAILPPTARNAARDLNSLLRAAELPGPFILVGHSFGGLIVRLYQQTHAEEVAGLVLVDPVVRAEWRNPDRKPMLRRGAMLSRRGALLAKLGVVRFALGRLTDGSQRVPGLLARAFAGRASGVANRLVGEVRKIPRELWPVVAAHWSEERAFRTMANYIENLAESCGQLNETADPINTPLTVLSASNASGEALQEHLHDTGISSQGEHLLVPDSGHWMNLDAPLAIVEAVRRTIAKL